MNIKEEIREFNLIEENKLLAKKERARKTEELKEYLKVFKKMYSGENLCDKIKEIILYADKEDIFIALFFRESQFFGGSLLYFKQEVEDFIKNNKEIMLELSLKSQELIYKKGKHSFVEEDCFKEDYERTVFFLKLWEKYFIEDDNFLRIFHSIEDKDIQLKLYKEFPKLFDFGKNKYKLKYILRDISYGCDYIKSFPDGYIKQIKESSKDDSELFMSLKLDPESFSLEKFRNLKNFFGEEVLEFIKPDFSFKNINYIFKYNLLKKFA